MKRNKVTALALVAALSLGTVSAAVADSNNGKGMPGAPAGISQAQLTTILAGLKTAGKLTDANIADINLAVTAFIASQVKPPVLPKPTLSPMPKGEGPEGPRSIPGLNLAARDAIIVADLGLANQAALTAARTAHKSLASLTTDPAKVTKLITDLVAFDTAAIAAAVTAKTLTALQQTALLAILKIRVTAEVNNARGFGLGDDDGKGKKPAGAGTLLGKPSASPSIHA